MVPKTSRTVSSSEGGAGRDRRLQLLFVTVLLDLVGFGIFFPLLPLYARDFGADGLQTGLLVSVYSLVQLVLAPVWGRISDRVGRRPVLIVGLAGSAVAYFVLARADTLAVLFLSRIVGGIGGSTIPVAQGYIADVTPPARRAGNMGLIGAAFGLGFVIGPMLGSILAGMSPGEPTVPGYAAMALCGANALMAVFFLPESRAPGERRRTSSIALRSSIALAASSRQILLILAVYLTVTMAFSTLQPTLSLLASERFALGAREAGYLFGLLGVVSAVVQGGLVRRVAPRIGERALLMASAAPLAAGLALMGLAPTPAVLVAGIVLVAVGYGGAVPSALSLLSRAVEPERQGATLGLGQSVGSCARVIWPTTAGFLFDIRLALPYLAAALLILVGALLARRLVQPEVGAGGASA